MKVQNIKVQKTNYLVFFPFLIALVLIAFGGGAEHTVAAGGTCYQVYMPVVIGNGGGAAGPLPAGPNASCDVGGVEVAADFNGDGYADLAIGSPHESVFFNGGNVLRAGAVNVMYGSASGISTTNNQIWHRGQSEIYRDPEMDDYFGNALAVGDFDDDGYSDLAIGVPGSSSSWPSVSKAGVVQVLYGSSAGLTGDRDEVWAQAITGIPGNTDPNDQFGAAVTTGDFNFDGYDDLAIGVIGESFSGLTSAGAINIIYGTSSGLSSVNSQIITQNMSGSDNPPANNDNFGFALTTGDFDNDGIDDLAVGIPNEDPNGISSAGGVQVFYGAGYGLVDTITNSVESDFWHADSNAYVDGVGEANDYFGRSVRAGDFNNDGFDDLAIGVSGEDHGSGAGTITDAGAINILYGSNNGLDATAAQHSPIWHQDSAGMISSPTMVEQFGFSLTVGDFNYDGFTDLGIGIPYEENNVGDKVGAISIMYGSPTGITSANNKLVFQAGSLPGANDEFGFAVSADDYNGDGFTDIAMGAPRDTTFFADTGSVTVRYGEPGGIITTSTYQFWHQGSPGMLGTLEAGERFGAVLP